MPEDVDHHDLSQQLAALSAGFAQHLRWQQARGRRGVSARPSPRYSPEPLPAEFAQIDVEAVVAPRVLELGAIRERWGDCQRCRLAQGRKKLVFGAGNPHADLLFVGEAPGYEEDLQGEPFVGPAGQLLTRMIAAMGLARPAVYITNIVKCRPPKNREPLPDEVSSCEPVLREQIQATQPRIIVALGAAAAKSLLKTDIGITRLRGSLRDYCGIPLLPTFHPAYLLRQPEAKRAAWNDLKIVMAEMDRLGLKRKQ